MRWRRDHSGRHCKRLDGQMSAGSAKICRLAGPDNRPVRAFDVLGISFATELGYTNMLTALDLAGIPLHAADRGEEHPIVVAGGFLLFMLPSVGGSYWLTFFPAVVVLGLGMAISVAPLTTTVMNAVPETKAGVASGINNAVSRTAGLLAVAVFGLVMLQGFNSRLNDRLREFSLAPEVEQELNKQRMRLADPELPASLDAATKTKLQEAINESFVSGFRRVALGSALLAVLSAISAWWLIEGKKVAISKS